MGSVRGYQEQEGRESVMKNQNSGGIGFAGLLTVAFIVLKLTKVIDWSWFWVLSPIIFSVSLVLLIIVFALSYYIIKELS